MEKFKWNAKVMGFESALSHMKMGYLAKREQFRDTCYVRIQYPDEHSMNTIPYIQMIKGDDAFPCTLSCESLLADDWLIGNWIV